MKRAVGFLCAAAVVLGLFQVLAPRLEAQAFGQSRGDQPRDGVCFYMDVDFRGESFCVNAGESVASVGERYNDKISSIRVFGRVQVVVFEDENFRGANRTVTGDVPNLDDFNDRISSFQVSAARPLQPRYGEQYGAPGRGDDAPPGACFYMDVDFQGESICVNAGESLASVGERYNDRISSIRVFGGVQVVVFEDDNFRGASRTVTGDVPNLDDFNDRITSVRVSEARPLQPRYGEQYEAAGRGGDAPPGACFYMDVDFQGESFCVNAGESRASVGDRFNDRISSIRVFGGVQVVVFVDENFRGTSWTVTEDMPRLGALNDQISSFRVTEVPPGQFEYGGRRGTFGRGSEPRRGACFYMDADYQGESFCLDAGEELRNLERRYNDEISSVRVFGRVRVIVYENEKFSGARMTLTRDVPNLGDFNDRISSIRVR